MMTAPLFLAFLIFATILWDPCNPVVNSIYLSPVHRRQQGKLRMMSWELVMDAEMKIKAVQRYRDQYYKSLQYQLGDIVYELRHFFKEMVVLYQAADRNISYDYINHNENIETFVQVQRMATEVINKVIMVQMWQNKRETLDEHHSRMKAVPRSGAKRTQPDELDEPLREVMVRARMARAAAARAGRPAPPPPPPPPLAGARARSVGRGSKRENKKWRHVSDRDFG